jgi:Leucine-rich repeat (LRR) protein
MANQPNDRTAPAAKKTGEEIAEERIQIWKNLQRRSPELMGRNRPIDMRILGLSRLGLKSVPESLRGLADIELLALGYNEITSLPEWMGEVGVDRLDVSANRLTHLPEGICATGAAVIDAEDNQLEMLPNCLREMPTLRQLYLHGNPRLGIPQSILNWNRP